MSVLAEHISLFMCSQPAAGIPLWTPAALAWTAPPPICNTEHRGGSFSVGPGPTGPTRLGNGTFAGIILPYLITKRPSQCGGHTLSYPHPLSFDPLSPASFMRSSLQTHCLNNNYTEEFSSILLQSQQTLWVNSLWTFEPLQGGVSLLKPEFLYTWIIMEGRFSLAAVSM